MLSEYQKQQQDKRFVSELEFKDKYVYNKANDQYVVYSRRLSKNIAVKGDTHRSMQRSYVNGRSVEEICIANNFPSFIFDEYKMIFGWTRDGFELSDEEVDAKSAEECIEDLRAAKKFEIIQEVEKREWRQTEEDARKWKLFAHGELNPFIAALDKWKPAKIRDLSLKIQPRKESYVMVASDWHIGSKCDGELSFRKQDWNKDVFDKFFKAYVSENMNKIKERRSQIDEIVLLGLGDILDGLRGKTEKGTELEQDLSREDQFNFALNKLTELLDNLCKLGIPIVVHSVKGNHDSLDNYFLFTSLSKIFAGKSIKFHIYKERSAFLVVKECLFLIDHGAHDLLKAKIPKNGAPRQIYVQSLFMSRPDLLNKHPNRYFVTGDLHTNCVEEHNDFEYIRVGSPARSLYADINNWHSRPSQSSFLITREGIKDIFRFYA
jgi:hypothetical protein